jgi:hypothetical protein
MVHQTMNIYHCPAQTFAGRYHIDPEPPQWCDAEVEEEGAYCAAHEEQDDDNPWGNDENEERT